MGWIFRGEVNTIHDLGRIIYSPFWEISWGQSLEMTQSQMEVIWKVWLDISKRQRHLWMTVLHQYFLSIRNKNFLSFKTEKGLICYNGNWGLACWLPKSVFWAKGSSFVGGLTSLGARGWEQLHPTARNLTTLVDKHQSVYQFFIMQPLFSHSKQTGYDTCQRAWYPLM